MILDSVQLYTSNPQDAMKAISYMFESEIKFDDLGIFISLFAFNIRPVLKPRLKSSKLPLEIIIDDLAELASIKQKYEFYCYQHNIVSNLKESSKSLELLFDNFLCVTFKLNITRSHKINVRNY